MQNALCGRPDWRKECENADATLWQCFWRGTTRLSRVKHVNIVLIVLTSAFAEISFATRNMQACAVAAVMTLRNTCSDTHGNRAGQRVILWKLYCSARAAETDSMRGLSAAICQTAFCCSLLLLVLLASRNNVFWCCSQTRWLRLSQPFCLRLLRFYLVLLLWR